MDPERTVTLLRAADAAIRSGDDEEALGALEEAGRLLNELDEPGVRFVEALSAPRS